jgi:putative tryptophan/tyrosine transport system substrate-binding protein
MRRRDFLGLLGGAAAAWPLAARGQRRERVARIGFLGNAVRKPYLDEFLAGLRDLGWVEGANLHVEYRISDGDQSRLPGFAAELTALDVDVIVTSGAAIYAARATATIPIVVIAAPDLVAMGLAASLAHPGGNITGLTTFLPQLIGKQLEILHAVAPSLTRAGFVMYRGSPINAELLHAASVAAEALGVQLRPIEIGGVGEFESAFPPAAPETIGGFVTTNDPFFGFNAAAVAAIAEKRRLIWIAPGAAAQGALIGYGVDYAAMYRHAAVFIDKILKGAKPGDIPIERPTKFRTVVNLKTAKALGVEIPPLLLAGADEVIE